MNLDQLIEYISDAVVDEIKGSTTPLNTTNTRSNLVQDRHYSETLVPPGQVLQQGPTVGGIKHLSGTDHDHDHDQSSHAGAGGTSGLFAKSEQEIKDIESKQGVLDKEVFHKTFSEADAKDFGIGGKYQEITQRWYSMTAEEMKNRKRDLPEILAALFQQANHLSAQSSSALVDKVNKFDSQNALYDKLKDNKDFNDLVDFYHHSKYVGDSNLGEAEYEVFSKRATIRSLVDQWASTSGDTDPKAIAMQVAAKQLFGTGELGHLSSASQPQISALQFELKFNPGRKAFLQAQYDATQEYLSKNNIKELVLYRGHEGKRSKLEGGNDVEVNLQPLSSFSMSHQIAMSFASVENFKEGARPSVIASIVPAKRIFALPNTGISCTNEREVVVLGGKTKATVIAGIPQLESVFSANTIRSANDIKVHLISKDKSNYPVLSSILEGKAAKPDLPNLDEDLENADWTKTTWDLPEYGSVAFDQFLESSGMTLEKFKTLPVYKWRKKPILEGKIGTARSEEIDDSLGLSTIFKGGPGSGIRGHRTFRPKGPSKRSAHSEDVANQLSKNLKGIAEGKAKHTDVKGSINSKNIKQVIDNMRAEADLYTSYLASDTAVKVRDMISIYENLLHEGVRGNEFKDIRASDFDDFGTDAIKKMVHQEIESNRQQFTDHGIRHIYGDTQRQIEIMEQMSGRVTAMDKLSAMAIMVNHDMGYTINDIRNGGENAAKNTKQHPEASATMFQDQKSQWDEGKLFSEKQFDKIAETIRTHDSTEIVHDKLISSARLSDNLALFAKEKLPSMFKYVKGGSVDLVRMGEAAKKKDTVAFESHRKNLYEKIDKSPLNENLKRDLKAGTKEISLMTPKFSMGVLAGEISSIKGNKKGKVNIEIDYNAWDSFLQNHFDMGQKQTKKLLGDYGITDFTKSEYDLGGMVNLKVIGAPSGSGRKKEIGPRLFFKGGPGSGNFGHTGRIGEVGGSGGGSSSGGSGGIVSDEIKNSISIMGFSDHHKQIIQEEMTKLDKDWAVFSNIKVRTWETAKEETKVEAQQYYGMLPPFLVSFRNQEMVLNPKLATSDDHFRSLVNHENAHMIDAWLDNPSSEMHLKTGAKNDKGVIHVNPLRYNKGEWFAECFARDRMGDLHLVENEEGAKEFHRVLDIAKTRLFDKKHKKMIEIIPEKDIKPIADFFTVDKDMKAWMEFISGNQKSYFPFDSIEEHLLSPSIGLTRVFPRKRKVNQKSDATQDLIGGRIKQGMPVLVKHLPGQHDQSTHAGKGGVISSHSPLTNLRQFNQWAEDNKEISVAAESLLKSDKSSDKMIYAAYDDYKSHRMFDMDGGKMKGAISYRKENNGYEIRFVGGTEGSGTRLIERVIEIAKKDNSTVFAEARMGVRSYFEKMKFTLREGTTNIFEFKTPQGKIFLQSEIKGCF